MLNFQFNFNKILKVIAIAFLIVGFLIVSSKTFAATGILKQINFQGKVVNSNGTNVANGDYSFLFCIYTVASPGTACTAGANNDAIWRESKTLTVTDGIFRTPLGDTTAFPGSVDFNTDNIYLGTNFNSDGQMTPLVRFTAVPYAFNALKVAGLTVTDTTGTFTLAAAKTLTVNNTLTFAGTDSTIITFQGTDTYVGRATTDTLTNKTIGSTGLTFSGAATDVTTASNEDFTLTPNGIGNTILTSDFNSGVLVGSSSNILAPLSVSGGIGSNALAIFNQTNSGDILAASASGTTKFRIANNGDAVLSAGITLGATNGTSAQCLLGGATAAWGSCSAGAGSNWDIVNGVITPKLTSTLDFLLGSQATASAKFAVLNINSGTPTATISANSSNNAAFLTGLGVLGTSNAQTLTLGNSSTGEILFSPGGTLALTARGTNLIAAGTLTGLTGLTVASGTVSLPSGQVDNVELANSSITVSATAGTGISVAGSPVSLGGTLTLAGIDASTSVKGVASFNTANFAVVTGDVTIKSGGVTTTEIAANTIDFADISDNPTLDGTTTIALGTGTQNFNLVLGTNATNGNIVIQPNAGGQAALIIDKKGINDIFTASASGATRFTVNTSGDIVLGSTTRLTNTGVGTFITGTVLGSQTFTTNNIADSAALTIKSGGTSALTLDTSGAAALNLGNTNATSLVFGNVTTNPTFSFNGSGLTTLGGSLTFSGTTARTVTGPATGGLTVNTTSGPLTLSTTTTGTLAVTSAGALNLTGAAASTWSIGAGNALALTSSNFQVTSVGVLKVLGGANPDITTITGGAGLRIYPATNGSGAGGLLLFSGGGASAGFTGGDVTIGNGNQGTNTSGLITIKTDLGGITGNVIIGSGNASAGTAGNIAIDVGTSSAGNGTISIGTAARAQTINIGTNATGGVITIGSATNTGLALSDAQWSVTDAGAATFASTTSPTYTGAGAVTVSSGGTSGLTFDSASGDITVAANDGLTFAATTLGNNGSRNVTINSGTGGTTATLIVKLDTSGTVVTTDTTTLNNAVGVALNTTTAGSAVRVAINGVVTATADNAVTAGDYIGLGTTTAGRAKSLGTTYPSTSGIQVIGRALGTQATPGSTFLLMLNGLDNNVAAGGGGGYNLIKDETISLTARTTLAFLGTAVTCADNAGLTQTECTISGAGGGVSFASGTPDNTITSNNLIQLQKSGVNRFVVDNKGGLTINGTDSSVVRTTTTEFATGTVGSNLTNANDQLELSDGTIPNTGKGTITTATQPATSANVTAGALSMTRADGKYFVLLGTTTTSVYDSVAGTFTAGTAITAIGVGAQALPRPDGRYLVIHGAAGATRTIIDPVQVVANTAEAGVNFCASSGAGAVSFKRADGRFLVVCGNGLATTAIYDPIANTWAVGPSFTVGVQSTGGLVLNRPDGQALIINGGATATTQLYNPNSGTANIGVFAAGPVLGTGCEINGAGSVAFRRQDGKFVVLSKLNASTIYDPVANTFTCRTANGPGTVLGDGAHAIPLQNGNFLILPGGAATASYIYDSSADTFTLHGTATTAVSSGAHSIMRDNGTWQILVGGSVTTTNNYDTGLPMTGTTTKYTSDDISTTSLNASSTLKWTAQYESPYIGRSAAANTAFSTIQFFVRTAVNAAGCTTPLNSAVDREILTPGDLIRPGSTDNCIRMTVQFNRPLPKRLFEERGTWTGNGSTIHRLDYATPTLFDIAVDNSTVLHRTNFDFTNPNAGSAAPQNETSGPTLTRAEGTRVEAISGHLTLPYGRLLPTTQVGTTGFYQGQTSGAHPALAQAQTNDGTIVIARPNRTFIVIASLTTPAANAALYDPASQTFTAQSGSGIPTAANGVGGFAIKRPDGKFLVVLGNAATTTNIYDPDANTFVAGPALSAAAGVGAMAILNGDSTYTIVHGAAATTSSIYNPVRNTMMVGPTLTTAANCGAWAIPMGQPHNNQHKVFVGVAAASAAVTTTMNYDANAKVFTAGTALTTAHGCGSFAFQRQDGWWVTIVGASAGTSSTATNILNPNTGTTILGPALSVAAGRGSHVIPRADGTFLILHAGATATLTSTVYFPWGGTFGVGAGIGTMAAGPALQTAAGTGAVSFQRPDGKWVIILGNATATVNSYDAGWYADGQYLSEQVNVPALSANSTLEWKQAPDNYVRMEIRTAASQAALGTTGYYSVGRPGQSIANAGGETWVQVEVNFRRDFPTFAGTLDGVYRTGGGMVYPYRNISLPTVFEYKLNNGMDLLNLQANGLNLLRVTSGGNIYSSATGGFYSGGADLAENYASKDSLEKGEVVVADGAQSVKRSVGQYQKDVLGVVSTSPGFVAGAYTEDSYPIALVGRVPVKVSTENGQIKAGDYLTSSSIPGYAMRANQAGRVLGKALENFDISAGSVQVKDCPLEGLGNLKTTKCGTVMMFVNLVDYLGAPVEMVMADQVKSSKLPSSVGRQVQSEESATGLVMQSDTGVILANEARPESDSGIITIAPSQNDSLSKEEQILAFLKQLKDEQASASAGVRSEIFTDRVSAVNEIITPHIITELLTAKKIKADSIEGLEILTDKISSLQGQVAGLSTQSDATPSAFVILGTQSEAWRTPESDSGQAGMTQNKSIEFESGKFTLDLTILGKLNANGGLIVLGLSEFKGNVNFAAQSTFQGETVFERLATFISNVIFRGKVTFEEVPTFNKDTAGSAIITKDTDQVVIVFDKEYEQIPFVTVGITIDTADKNFADKTLEEQAKAQETLENDLLSYDLKYFVTKRNSKGFVIKLNKKAPIDIPFSWHAIAVKDSIVFKSKPPVTEPTSTPFPILEPTIEPSITPSQEASPSASLH